MANVPPFALAPSLVNGNQPIDYSTRYGQALFDKAVAPLPIVFNGKAENVMPFLQAVSYRANVAGWNDILEIRDGIDAAGDPIHKNLLQEFPQISIATIITNALNDYVGQPIRNAQASAQLFHCLAASITEDVAQRMIPFTENYTVGGTLDGPCYLKTLMDVCLMETAATTRLIRESLMNLEPKMSEYSNNIEDFNNYVLLQLKLLSARGETTNDLMNSLLKAYKSVPDKEFVRYIKDREAATDDGREDLGAQDVMDIALNKYKLLTQHGEWMEPDPAEAKLVALTAQLELLKKNNVRLQGKLKKPFPKREKGKEKGKDPIKKKKKNNDDKWAWKDVKPKDGAPTTKVVNGKTYHWCVHHKKWTLHKSEECRLTGSAGNPTENPDRLHRNMVAEIQEEGTEDQGFDADLE